jgi:hypothetical protein
VRVAVRLAARVLAPLVVLAAGCTESTDLLPLLDGGALDGCSNPGPPIALVSSDACAGALAAREHSA